MCGQQILKLNCKFDQNLLTSYYVVSLLIDSTLYFKGQQILGWFDGVVGWLLYITDNKKWMIVPGLLLHLQTRLHDSALQPQYICSTCNGKFKQYLSLADQPALLVVFFNNRILKKFVSKNTKFRRKKNLSLCYYQGNHDRLLKKNSANSSDPAV